MLSQLGGLMLRIGLVVVVACSSLPVRADCAIFRGPTIVPFASSNVPINAEFLLITPERSGALFRAEGEAVGDFPIINSEGAQKLELSESLEAGDYRLELPDGTTHNFSKTSEEDLADPATPGVSAQKRSVFTPPSPPYTECPSESGTHYYATVEVDGARPTELVFLNGAAVAAGTGDTLTLGLPIDQTDSEVTVKIVDMAGNVSGETIATLTGCACSSSSFTPTGSLVAVLLFMARRKKAPSESKIQA